MKILLLILFLALVFRFFRKRKITLKKLLKGLCIFTAVVLVLLGAGFAWGIHAVRYNGKYASRRAVYTNEQGWCILITYNSESHAEGWRKGDAEGFCIAHFPLLPVFPFLFSANQDGKNAEDSVDFLDLYNQLVQTDTIAFDQKVKSITQSDFSMRSRTIGNYGNYFVFDIEQWAQIISDTLLL